MDFFFLEAHALMRNPPAYAGNTFIKLMTSVVSKAHPRLRGEYRVLQISVVVDAGSPPLTRGIRM